MGVIRSAVWYGSGNKCGWGQRPDSSECECVRGEEEEAEEGKGYGTSIRSSTAAAASKIGRALATSL